MHFMVSSHVGCGHFIVLSPLYNHFDTSDRKRTQSLLSPSTPIHILSRPNQSLHYLSMGLLIPRYISVPISQTFCTSNLYRICGREIGDIVLCVLPTMGAIKIDHSIIVSFVTTTVFGRFEFALGAPPRTHIVTVREIWTTVTHCHSVAPPLIANCFLHRGHFTPMTPHPPPVVRM